MRYELYEVGGRVRDKFLGIPSKDVDYSVVVPHHDGWGDNPDVNIVFGLFVNQLRDEGFKIWLTTPDMFTVRAKFPAGHKNEGLDADFVLARKEGDYIVGTRKPKVTLGTLHDDLERRDFTVNAMAEDIDGNIVDPFGGQRDLQQGILRTIGDTAQSFNDDPLRILRMFRFAITKNLNFSGEAVNTIKLFQPTKMNVVSTERIANELERMFKHDTPLTFSYLKWLDDMNPALFRNILRDGMWFLPTMKS